MFAKLFGKHTGNSLFVQLVTEIINKCFYVSNHPALIRLRSTQGVLSYSFC